MGHFSYSVWSWQRPLPSECAAAGVDRGGRRQACGRPIDRLDSPGPRERGRRCGLAARRARSSGKGEGLEPVNAARAACTQRCPQATGAVRSFVRARSLTASMLGQRSTRLTFCCGSSAVPRLHRMRLVSSFASPAGMVPEPVIVDQGGGTRRVFSGHQWARSESIKYPQRSPLMCPDFLLYPFNFRPLRPAGGSTPIINARRTCMA